MKRSNYVTIYLKLDTSKASNDKIYYFTDGKNALSENMTYKKSIEMTKFLKSVGITVEDRSH